jgi:hypothetical protein
MNYSPFYNFAGIYNQRGWHPVPLWDGDAAITDESRNAQKRNPLAGYTGRGGANATLEQIENWRNYGMWISKRRQLWPCFNFAVRMPDNVVALDVDAYDGGADTLAGLEREHGPLPLTYSATARCDGSGHRYYRVDGRRIWRDPGPGIQIVHWGWRYAIVHWGWRYAVAPPSVHPETGTCYVWHTPDGTIDLAPPWVSQLPPLPEAWVRHLDTGHPIDTTPTPRLRAATTQAYIDAWDSEAEPPCRHMRKVLDALSEAAHGRHGTCTRSQYALVRHAERGHPGLGEALDELKEWFVGALAGDRDGEAEFTAGLVSAVSKIVADPSEDYQRTGCRSLSLTTPSLEDFMAGRV